jgi:3D (Asp-Asp-Asp) domain-containing protein
VKVKTRNFVFLTIALTLTASLQFPQVQLAQNLNSEATESTTLASAKTTAPLSSPSTEEISSANATIKNFKENSAAVSSEKAVSAKKAVSGGSFTATAYALKGRTASGAMVRRGIIAADPRVLPLGTRVQISAGTWSGTYVVADTGGAVKGRKIDVWVPHNQEARRFGRRTVSLTVLGRK